MSRPSYALKLRPYFWGKSAGWLLDSGVESVSITIPPDSLDEGQNLVFVRGRDTDGNWGAVSAVLVDYTPDPCDVNGDGAVDAVDVQLVINGALGLPIAHESDVNGDGSTNALDVQLVINAVLGVG